MEHLEHITFILQRRDGETPASARELFLEARNETKRYFFGDPDARDPETILAEDFGLEPDYIDQLI